MTPNDKLLDFFLDSGKLKSTQRTGWTKHNISKPESVADHSWRTALISMVLANRMSLEANRAARMALVHDLAETKTGDIQRGEMQKNEKDRLETNALKEILANVDEKNSENIASLCAEYKDAKTTVAKLVRDADNLDMMIQALEYENVHRENLSEFFENEFHFAETKALAKEIKARRAS